MNKFYQTPDKVAMFFDLSLLRDIEQTLFTGTLKQHVTKNVFVRTLQPADQLRIRNTGSNSFGVCLSNTADIMGSTIITVLPGEERMVPVPEFSVPDLRLYHFLNIENKTDGDTSFEVEIE